MLLNISFNDRPDIIQVELPPSMSVEDVIAFVVDEAGKNANGTHELIFNNQKLSKSTILENTGIADGDMLVLSTLLPPQATTTTQPTPSTAGSATGQGPVPNVYEALAKKIQLERIRKQLLNDKEALAFVSTKSPGLAQAINDPEQFAQIYTRFEQEQAELNKPANAEIDHNFQMAIQEMPEAFVPVSMLFASVEVNGTPITAFVDSGAQATIMSPECVKKCHLENLVDTRHRGMAYGVGKATIVGRIHMAPIKLGSSFFPCSITVIEGAGIDFLLGLDMLKHHQATIDLKNNQLMMGDEVLKFLGDSEIPEGFANLNKRENDTSPGIIPDTTAPVPNGSTASSGPNEPKFPENVITSLIQLGFTRSEVIDALKKTGGNADLAASLLFGA